MSRGSSTAAAPITLAAILASLALTSPAGAAEPELLVVLRATSAVAGPFVRLGEIADLPGGPARLRAFASEVLLGFAPGHGDVREIESFEVEARLGESGLAGGRFLVKGAPRVSVFIAGDGAPGDARFPEKAVASEAPEKDRPNAGPRGGRTARRNASEVLSAGATRPLAAEAPAGSGRPRNEPRPPGEARPAGRTRSGSGEPAGKERPTGGVDKGDTVVLRKVGRTLILEEPARILEAGGPGDRIEVQNLRTGKKLRARVDGPGAVTPLDEREDQGGGRGE
jgi:hypothetical protein